MTKQAQVASSESLVINSVEVAPIVVQGQRVLTLAMIDQVHGRPEGTARKRFNDNKKRLSINEDYFELTASEIRTQSLNKAFAARTGKGILLTESGYLLLVKSFTDDLAWQVQKQLVKAYFQVQAATAPTPADSHKIYPATLTAMRETLLDKINFLQLGERRVYVEIAEKLLCEEFGVSRFSDLTELQGKNAIEWLENRADLRSRLPQEVFTTLLAKHDRALIGEHIPAEKPQAGVTLSAGECLNLYGLLNMLTQNSADWRVVEMALHLLGSNMAMPVKSQIQELKLALAVLEDVKARCSPFVPESHRIQKH